MSTRSEMIFEDRLALADATLRRLTPSAETQGWAEQLDHIEALWESGDHRTASAVLGRWEMRLALEERSVEQRAKRR
jgi:hypothetical protein